tara:strand:+ start:20 stop:1210 length:1191 start_codon:yes stop_codon:yes gene_type:complete
MAKVLDSDCSGSWGDWGDCTQGCSYEGSKGEKVRMYSVKSEATGEGKACPYDDGEEEVQECGKIACTPTDCVGNWTAWSVEGVGANAIEKRSWDVTQEPKYGGAECSVEESARMETKAATTSTPSVDCVGSWVNVGMCSETCGPDGKQKRRYDVTTAASGPNGKSCTNSAGVLLKDGDIDETEECNTDIVCPVNCVGSFSNWSSCSESCGPGKKRRTYSVTTPVAGTGTACAYDDGHEETADCEDKSCNVDCEGSWIHYPNVNDEIKAGFGGHKTMKYVVTKPKSGTGKDCMHAFTREAPKVGATDVPRNWAGYIQNTNDRWTSEVVTDGQIAEVFTYQNQASEQESRLKTPDYIKYCMRKPGTVSKNVKTGRDGVYTDAYGQDNDIKSHMCDDDD